ncbi:MAG: hypothetical protein ACKV2T_08080 [Kofleriaceae bacterium]
MPAAFTEWTVLPHNPIEKLAPNLWRVSGKLGKRVQRQMMLAKMDDGRVVVHNAIALDDSEMAELEAWGEPSVIFVPNGFHRMDAAIWKQRYPTAKVVAPRGAKQRVAKVVGVDAVTEEMPKGERVDLQPLDGCPMEGVMITTSDDGVTLTFCDAVCNMPKLGFPMNVMMGPTGMVSAPRVMRLIAIKDKRAMAANLERLAATPDLARLTFGHGKPVTADPVGELRRVIAQLRG